MNIKLSNVGRRFNKEWIFKGLTYDFKFGEKYAILGPNGSGKSTLLSILSGSLTTSEGEISFFEGEEGIAESDIYQHISLAAPYLELIEQFTLNEMIDFHFKFKDYAEDLNAKAVMSVLGLEQSQDKAIKYFSSGMKQRAKLVLACCSNSPILLLDEPTSNLDTQGIEWYHQLIKTYANNRLVIVGSNQEQEYSFCDNHIKVTDYK